MQRREFLKALAAIAPAPLIARSGLGNLPRRVLIQKSPVAGFQYHDGEKNWPNLRVGDRLRLVREPNNRHDRRAVRVDWHRRQLGYIPRRDNAAVSQMLDSGQSLEAQIERLRQSLDPWERVLVRVELTA